MAVISISGTRRDSRGKNAARKVRAAGQIPAVMYGHGEEPIPVAVDARTFQLALRHHKGGNAIVNLAVSGSEYTALIRDVQYDPVSRHVIHLDFQHISLTETVEVSVTVHLTGLPVGVKDGGGILEHITREVEVRGLPTALPPSIDVDVSGLNIGDSVHVRDLPAHDITILTDPDTTIATVVAPSVVEEKPAEEVAAAVTTAEPEVITKGKKDDEEGEDKPKEKDKAKEKEKK
jgi:large subunit ribosomal protein L25